MKSVLLALPLVLAAAKGQAAETLLCELTQFGSGNWIPEILFVGYEEGADTAVVSDPVILTFNGGPTQAQIVADNARRITFAWDLRANDGRGNYVGRFIYRATLQKGSLQMTISATPAGYANRFTGRGTCRREAR
ncbi:hypothetical protein ROJ8625_01070 [Roseivivax jejudonensis]|uniref:Uncharacterized protein n=1 Tax=Roseivivax jejudonensis TaxID=1529041 RepID=A0A1X6YN68_9RHOB|nr:hypothetical protein [Roseivivax jejudonensis]SLN26479.1 hypothetical protein ROJ8625_01070 [Roseivivax jejudonensis]